VIVHNSGKANEVYIDKAGALARVNIGERLPVTVDYFSQAIKCMKKVVVTLYKAVLHKFGNVKVEKPE
jgi:hypothetical protein